MTKQWCPYICKDVGKIIHVFDPIYTCNFYGIAGVSNKTFREIVQKQLKLKLDPSTSQGKFYCITRFKQDCGLIWSVDKSVHLIHECLHATFWALESRGMKLTAESEEAFTYHHSFLFKCLKGRARG